MSEMPAKIWALGEPDDGGRGYVLCAADPTFNHSGRQEYVRADLHDALRAELEEARKALAPFAAEANRIAPEGSEYIGDSCQIWQCGSTDMTRSRITYGDLRRARAFLDRRR